MTRPPISRPGSEREYEPEARTTFLPTIVVVADLNGVRGGKAALASEYGDAVRLDEALQALELAGNELLAEAVHCGDVDRLNARVNAVRRAFAGDVGYLCGVEERLRRNAAAVQACASELVLLNDRRGHSELRGSNCSGVSGASATKNYDVKLVLGQVGSPSVLCVFNARSADTRHRDRPVSGAHLLAYYFCESLGAEPRVFACRAFQPVQR